MKFFHLSDLHIGIRLFEHDLREDQEYIFDQIIQTAVRQQPDAVVIAGDIYDKSIPAAEAVTLFDRFVGALLEALPQAELLIISGNHDSAPRLDLFRDILSRQRVHMIGLPPMEADDHIEKVTLTDQYGPVNFYLLPFVKPSFLRKVIGTDEKGGSFSYDEAVRRLLAREDIDTTQRNVLVSHQFYLPVGKDPASVERARNEVTTVGNIDSISADVLTPFDYAALGHIHKPMKAGSEVWRYCGTPLPYSVSEAGQQKGILQVEMGEKGQVSTTVLPLTPLRQVRIITGSLAQVLAQACGDFVTVQLTDEVDLDVVDLQDRLHAAFPYLLEIRRTAAHSPDSDGAAQQLAQELDPFQLCCSFLGELDQESLDILQDVINSVQEVQA